MRTQRVTRILLGAIAGCVAGSFAIALGAPGFVGVVVLALVLAVAFVAAGWSPRATGDALVHKAVDAIHIPEGPRPIRVVSRVALLAVAAVFASAFAAYAVKGSPTAIIPTAIKDLAAPSEPPATIDALPKPTDDPTVGEDSDGLRPGDATATPDADPTPLAEPTQQAQPKPTQTSEPPAPKPTKKPSPKPTPKPEPTPTPTPTPTDDPDLLDIIGGILNPPKKP